MAAQVGIPRPDAAGQEWVRTTHARLNLREKIGQLFQPLLAHWDRSIPQEELNRRILEHRLGAGFVFWRHKDEVAALAHELQAAADVPLLLAGDYECGPAISGAGTGFGLAMGLGAVADMEEGCRLAERIGHITAEQGRAAGVHWTLAPVVDLNLNPDNPITNVRAYGDNPERVAALASAYIRGLAAGGMGATIKHFPGDGWDDRDQHLVTAFNRLDEAAWERTYGVTFRAGLAAGACAVMAGHIAWPAFSSRDRATGRHLPATLDAALQVDFLRGRLGFEGVLISDAVGMGGMQSHCVNEAESVVRNIAAGSDMALFVEDVPAALEAVRDAVRSGRLPLDRIDEAVRRVLELKARLGLHRGRGLPADGDRMAAAFDADRTLALARELAEKSVTLLRDFRGQYPLRLAGGDKVVIFELPDENTDIAAMAVAGEKSQTEPRRNAICEELKARGIDAMVVADKGACERALPGAAALIYLLPSAPQAGRGSIRLSLHAHRSIDWKRVQAGFPAYFVSLGSPYVLREISGAPNFACLYCGEPEAQRAYVKALLGERSFLGRCPVSIPDCD